MLKQLFHVVVGLPTQLMLYVSQGGDQALTPETQARRGVLLRQGWRQFGRFLIAPPGTTQFAGAGVRLSPEQAEYGYWMVSDRGGIPFFVGPHPLSLVEEIVCTIIPVPAHAAL